MSTSLPMILSPHDAGRVAVLFGGDSSEREVSLESGRNVSEALQRYGYQVEMIDGIAALIAAASAKRINRVFNIMHGAEGENGVVPGLLQAFGIACTGSGVLGAALTLDKIRTKQVWLAEGLATPRYLRVEDAAAVASAAEEIGYPLIIKPSLEGSSVGVSRVFSAAELDAAVALAQRHSGELLMEELIIGDELTVGILGDTVLPSIHIVPATDYYDYHAKYRADDTQYHCPGLTGKAEQEIRLLSKRAFDLAGASGWGRVDLMRDRAGKAWLLEVNTTPGMTSHSLVPKAAAQIGIEFDELVARILGTSQVQGEAP
jgi:D-alanine-D-alanine ligase